jgi:hypothetical protein
MAKWTLNSLTALINYLFSTNCKAQDETVSYALDVILNSLLIMTRVFPFKSSAKHVCKCGKGFNRLRDPCILMS